MIILIGIFIYLFGVILSYDLNWFSDISIFWKFVIIVLWLIIGFKIEFAEYYGK